MSRNKYKSTEKYVKPSVIEAPLEPPTKINMTDFIKSRLDEIKTMETLSVKSMGNDKITEQLPRLMRRRAASHDHRRLPRRLHAVAKQMMSRGQFCAAVTKRPSRRHRRRPSRLVREVKCTPNTSGDGASGGGDGDGASGGGGARTTTTTSGGGGRRRLGWLNTHVWHAKRFRVCQPREYYGHRVPMKPADKGSRAAYRAVTKYSTIQDTSFMQCIQLSSAQLNHITTALEYFLPKHLNYTLHTDGTQVSRVMLYDAKLYPAGAICPATIMFKSPDTNTTDHMAWLWVDPCDIVHVLSLIEYYLKQNCGEIMYPDECDDSSLESAENGGEAREADKSINEMDVDKDAKMEVEQEMMHVDKECLDLKDEDNENIDNSADENEDSEVEVDAALPDRRFARMSTSILVVTTLSDLTHFTLTGPASVPILHDILHLPDNVEGNEEHVQQLCYFTKHLDSAPANSITSITIKDPRLVIPQHKTKVAPILPGDSDATSESKVSRKSDLWSESHRMQCSNDILSVQQTNKMRSQCLTNGGDLELDRPLFPLLLIANEQANGFDLIACGCLAMPLWIPLIYRGARAIGQLCQDDARTDSCRLRNPQDMPDTAAGQLWASNDRDRLHRRHLRYPPSKRPNYEKLGRMRPFSCDWSTLAGCGSDAGFYVCREPTVLRALAASLVAVEEEQAAGTKERAGLDARPPSGPRGCLVAVRVEMKGRGVPNRFARVISRRDGGDVVGYVVSGKFSYAVGRGVGVAYVLADKVASNRCVDIQGSNVKTRNQAKLSIIL